MKSEQKSSVLIKNGYCCGHGQIIQRLENWLIRKKIPYKTVPVKEASTASYNGKTISIGPRRPLQDIVAELGLKDFEQK